MNQVRVRIAPSPTGIPHIGNTRTALFNFLFAKKNNGMFMLRIEDTDRERFVAESEKAIYEILDWLGLKWDGEIVKQSQRLKIYKKHADELLGKKLAYEDKGAIWFRMPKVGKTQWKDAIGEKEIVFENKEQEDFVILKSDGYPTYNFANVIDDHLMKISHVIRGEEFISSTPKHIQLYEAFGFEKPLFAHLPLILSPDHQKLSKRHGAKSALDYRDEGYLKEALLNYMALLGWNPGGNRELMTLSEMIELFDLKDINTSNPVFDAKKLEWMNGVYIRKSQISNLKSQILERNPNLKKIEEKMFDQLLKLAQSRMKTLKDFYELVEFIFEEVPVQLTTQEKKIAQELFKKFSTVKHWSNEAILISLKKVLSETNSKMPVAYKIMTGKESGLPLPQVLEILGKEKTLEKLS